MSNIAHSLCDSFGWSNSTTQSNKPLQFQPIIEILEPPSISSDVIFVQALCGLLQSGHVVFIIAAKYPFSHLSQLATKIGHISLSSYIKNKHLFIISALSSELPTLEDPNASQTALPPVPTFQGLFARLALVHHSLTTSEQPNHVAPPFSVCIDDLSLLSLLNCPASAPLASPLRDTQDFLSNILRLTSALPRDTNTTTVAGPTTNDASVDNRHAAGTLLFALTLPPDVQRDDIARAPSSLFSPVAPISLLLPLSSASQVNPLSHAQFDTAILSSGLAGHVTHWVNQQTVRLAHEAPESISAPLVVELSSLPSGYSQDIYCQIVTYQPPSVVYPTIQPSVNNLQANIRILYLSVDNNGNLTCHART